MDALIVVDVQNDFLPGGALAVNVGDEVIPFINEIQQRYDFIVGTQDWHPDNHGSFASNHEGEQIGNVIELHGIQQILWPDHCIQNSKGAELAEALNTNAWQKIFTKGTDIKVDSYSGFYDNDHKTSTGLGEFLISKGIQNVHVVGLATDYCVKYTALDAVKLGFNTTVLAEGTRAVNLQPKDFERSIEEMRRAGVFIK